MIWIQNQLVGAMEGEQMTLECHSEAYPKSINYWTKDNGEIIAQGKKQTINGAIIAAGKKQTNNGEIIAQGNRLE